MARDKKASLSVQQQMPLQDYRGWLAVMTDGTTRGFLRFPGKNQSLVTKEEARHDAFLFADVLSTINVPFSLLIYPIPVSSSSYLVQIDKAIARERSKMYAAKTERDAEVCRLKMAILEQKMRPDAKRESTSGDRLQWPVYAVLKFSRRQTIEGAEAAMENLIQIAEDKLGKPPQRVDVAEFTLLCGRYFSPSSTGANSCVYSTGIPLPDLR